MDVKEQVAYWIKSAKDDLETAEVIFKNAKRFHYCLFFCHLTLEKGLKALVVKHTEKTPPKIHDLEILSEKADLNLSDDMKRFFSLMNTFNLEARYPDEKFKIYKKSTKQYAEPLLNKTKATFQWIKEESKR